VPQVVQALGITEGAVRGRLKRGTLRSHRGPAQCTWCLRAAHLRRDEPVGESTGQSELVEELRRTNELLREVITTREEEPRRRDTIIMNMTEAMKALNPPTTENSSEARGSPESPSPTDELGDFCAELDTERTRREMAESTLREGMDEERRRREETEREHDNLRRELYALREPREPPETASEEPERAESRPATGEAQEGVRRPWWRRVLGG
jgi:hypothetical protein